MADCAWCKYVPNCPDKNGDKCDFKTLKWDKDVIVKRVSKEYEYIKKARAKAVAEKDPIKLNKIMAEVMDKGEGIKIMMDVLTKEFKVKPKELKESLNIEDMSFTEKMKIFMKLQMLKNKRRSKK